MLKRLNNYFTIFEKILWTSSVALILLSYFLFASTDGLTLAASVIGVTALILGAKGNPLSQILMIVFSIIYGIISYTFEYYGEMITYLGMSMPMAAFSLVSWLRNPYKGKKSEVEVGSLKKYEYLLIFFLTLFVTVIFYFILKVFGTANLIPSTVSVTTSFLAVYLTFRRNPYFALAYALNDVVLIILWILAAMTNISYVSVIICFLVFLANDIYGFVSWQKMKKRQEGRTDA
ncbi:MAG: nicotinamide mononucleotide transporter [Clostridia bacterium]|nr:nicotinamide mononucleotide transporter [Clostridia bacterium]